MFQSSSSPVTPVTEADDRQAPFSEKVMRYAIYYPLALSIVKKKKNVSVAHLIYKCSWHVYFTL